MTKGQECLMKVVLRHVDELQGGAISVEQFVIRISNDMAGGRVYWPRPKTDRPR